MRFVFFTLVFFMMAMAQAQEKIRKLELPGFTEKTKQKIYEQIPALKDGTWQGADLDRLIEILVRDEQYDSARITRESDNVYRLSVGRIRRISRINLTGASFFSDSELRRELGLLEKSAFDPAILIEAGDRIRLLYESQGFPKTQIDLQYVDSQKSEVEITVVIREGPRTLIDSSKVISSNPELEKLLLRILKKFKGEPLTEKTLADLRARSRDELSRNGYWRTELPEPKIELNFEESKAHLTFRVDRSDQFFFEPEGNKKINKSEMQDALQLETFYSSNPNIASEMGSKVRALYLAKGFARAEVQAEEMDGVKPGQRRIVLKVNEGPRVKIEKYEFSGTFSQPPKFYSSFLEDYSSPVIEDGYYVKEDLDQGLKNLVTDRWNQGYLRAKLVSTRTVYNKERDKVTVYINFDEGPLTIVQKIQFEGNKSISAEELLKVVNLQEGKPLRLTALEEAVLNLKQYYRDKGFLEMLLENEKEGPVSYSEDNALVQLNFKIYEGPQVHVAGIVVEGNNLTREEVILKELEFKQGDILTPQKIEESISRLQRLGHFSSIDIRTLEEKTSLADRTVVVKVTDRDPGLFNFGAGMSNERELTIRGYSGIAYRNIAGTGRGVSGRVDAQYNVANIRYLERKFTLGYLEPYLFDTRVRGRADLTQAFEVNEGNTKKATERKQIAYSFEQDITSRLLAIWEVWKITTLRDFYIDGNQEISLLNIASTAGTLDFDYRDHPFNPSKGTFTRFNIEYGTPWMGSSETIDYVRAFASFTHYQSLRKSSGWVWANSYRTGVLQNLYDKKENGVQTGGVPYDKKGFRLGGQSTVRGFTPDEAFPNKYDLGDVTTFNLQGRATMHLFKSELRFPVWGNVGGAVFYDTGQVMITGQDPPNGYEPSSEWRQSAGFAARYVTPVGAVSLEMGWKLPPRGERNENAWGFHLSIGTF